MTEIITTAEELDALPVGSVFVDGLDNIGFRQEQGFLVPSGTWRDSMDKRSPTRWQTAEQVIRDSRAWGYDALPLTVLYRPDQPSTAEVAAGTLRSAARDKALRLSGHSGISVRKMQALADRLEGGDPSMTDQIITTAEELDEFVDAMGTDYVFATDANAQPWIIYSTEDDIDAVTFPMETEDGRTEVEVSDVVASIDGLELPLTIVYRPGQPASSLPPTCHPSRVRDEIEYIARTVAAHYRDAGKTGEDVPGDWIAAETDKRADAVLALLPGRSEAEVKAEARREVLEWISSGSQTVGGLTTIDQVLSGLADPDNPPFGCAAGGEGRG